MLLGTRLERECRYYTPDQRFWIFASGRSRYADGSIICGKPNHPPHDAQATTNPLVVIEVLSPSSEGDDAGDKRDNFQTLPALQAYVVVSQDRRLIRIHRRLAHGGWSPEAELYSGGETFALPALEAPIAVDEVYENILDARATRSSPTRTACEPRTARRRGGRGRRQRRRDMDARRRSPGGHPPRPRRPLDYCLKSL
jgi:Uma2 family endonuclease